MWQVVHGSQEQCSKLYPIQRNLITSPVPLIHVWWTRLTEFSFKYYTTAYKCGTPRSDFWNTQCTACISAILNFYLYIKVLTAF